MKKRSGAVGELRVANSLVMWISVVLELVKGFSIRTGTGRDGLLKARSWLRLAKISRPARTYIQNEIKIQHLGFSVSKNYSGEGGGSCLPRWSVAKCDPESDPSDVDPTPKRGRTVNSTFGWSIDENIDQSNYKRSSIALSELQGQYFSSQGHIEP